MNVTGGLTCLVFFSILVRLETDLGKYFSDMAFSFLNFFILPISLLLISYFIKIICTLSITFMLYVSIVSIVWCKLLNCLLICYSYLNRCYIKRSFVIVY